MGEELLCRSSVRESRRARIKFANDSLTRLNFDPLGPVGVSRPRPGAHVDRYQVDADVIGGSVESSSRRRPRGAAMWIGPVCSGATPIARRPHRTGHSVRVRRTDPVCVTERPPASTPPGTGRRFASPVLRRARWEPAARCRRCPCGRVGARSSAWLRLVSILIAARVILSCAAANKLASRVEP